jgi:hypothetical protein
MLCCSAIMHVWLQNRTASSREYWDIYLMFHIFTSKTAIIVKGPGVVPRLEIPAENIFPLAAPGPFLEAMQFRLGAGHVAPRGTLTPGSVLIVDEHIALRRILEH